MTKEERKTLDKLLLLDSIEKTEAGLKDVLIWQDSHFEFEYNKNGNKLIATGSMAEVLLNAPPVLDFLIGFWREALKEQAGRKESK